MAVGLEAGELVLQVTGAGLVEDDGSDEAGLARMRSRAAMYGGSLHAGPNGDGWSVRAVLPL